MQRPLSRAASLACSLLLCVAATAATPSETDALADLLGRWRLDRAQSDPFDPVMKAMEVPWLMRRMASLGTIHFSFRATTDASCRNCPRRLVVVEETPVRSAEYTIVLDGVERPGEDPIGNATIDRFSETPEGALVLERRRTLRSGKRARIRDVRTRGGGPDEMLSQLEIWLDGELAVKARRVFVRATGS